MDVLERADMERVGVMKRLPILWRKIAGKSERR